MPSLLLLLSDIPSNNAGVLITVLINQITLCFYLANFIIPNTECNSWEVFLCVRLYEHIKKQEKNKVLRVNFNNYNVMCLRPNHKIMVSVTPTVNPYSLWSQAVRWVKPKTLIRTRHKSFSFNNQHEKSNPINNMMSIEICTSGCFLIGK